MSGSNKKQAKAASAEQAMKQQRSQRREAEEQKKQKLNTTIGVVVAVVVLALVAWNQGLFTSKTVAFSINGTSYTPAQVQLYYQDLLYNALMGQYTPEEGGQSYDFQTPTTDQLYSETATWHDFFTEEACRTLAKLHLVNEEAKSQNFQLPEEAATQLASTRESLETMWLGYSSSKSSFLKTQFNMTESEYLAMAELEIRANYYQTSIYEGFEFSDADYDNYYEENKNSLDVINYSQFRFEVTKEVEYDDEGNALEVSEEEEAVFEGLKVLASEDANKALEALEAGASFEEIEEDYAAFLNYTVFNTSKISSSFTGTDDASTWILSEEREIGDIGLAEDTVGDTCYYTITIFEGRERAEAPISDIRHILIPANAEDNYGEVTDEGWESSREIAQDLLDQWVADGADPEAFSNLAIDHSVDTSSASNGGVMTSVTAYDSLAQDFAAWIADESRETGDYGLVQNTESSIQGWHLMYFDDRGLPLWEENTRINLANEAMEAWTEETTGSVESDLTFHSGKNEVVPVSLF